MPTIRILIIGIILSVYFSSESIIFSQNLVPNHSFETGKTGSEQKFPDLWESDFLYGSYFVPCPVCSKYHGSGKPRNKVFQNSIKPENGSRYAGFYTYSYSDKRGYWGVKLKEKLQKDHRYKIEMYVNRYWESGIFLKDLQVILSKDKPGFVNTNLPLPEKTYDFYDKNNKITELSHNNSWLNKDTAGWMKIYGIYTADGTENFITIGNFRNNKHTEHLCEKGEDKKDSMAYYFTDNVSVIDVTDKLFIEPGKPLVLKNIFFDTGKYELLPASFPELQKLANYLKENPDKKIEISGHTDNTGSYDLNMKLSDRRAEAVKSYLIKKGINKNRLKHKGYGSTKPVDTNKTPQGRQNNRRVEVKIIKN